MDTLALHGVKRVFAVPGESYLAVLDGLHGADIQTVVVRQEGGASYMAEAHGKLTGEPGVAMVTRGPGAANAFIALHTAWQDGTPMVLFVGLVPVADRMRESFQEFDPHAWFGTQTKRVFVLDEPSRASEVVAEAFFAAKSGRPGPVVVGLPEDIITQDFTGVLHHPIPVSEGAISTSQMNVILGTLKDAEKPLLFIGGQRWTPSAAAKVTAFAERNNIPVAQDWHASDRVPFSSPINLGSLGYSRNDTAARMFETADVVVAIGAVPGDVATDGFTLRQHPDAGTHIISIDTSLRGHSGAVSSHIIATPVAVAEALDILGDASDLGRQEVWATWTATGHAAHLDYASIAEDIHLPRTAEGTAHMSTLVRELVGRLPHDAINSIGAGNHTLWAQRFFPTEVFPSQLATRNGSMGYSIPAAVAAALESPERLTVAICGDGEFLMNGQELATAIQYNSPLLAIVLDNGQYATIRAHQERHFPGRISGTQLINPDFAALSRAFGAHGETVRSDKEAADAVERALEAVLIRRTSALIHVVADQTIIEP